MEYVFMRRKKGREGMELDEGVIRGAWGVKAGCGGGVEMRC